MTIEVAKIVAAEWPPTFSTATIPESAKKRGLEERDVSIASVLKDAGLKVSIKKSDRPISEKIACSAGRPWERDHWDERELHEAMATQIHDSQKLCPHEWHLWMLVVGRCDGGPMLDRDGMPQYDSRGRWKNAAENTLGLMFDDPTGRVVDAWTRAGDWINADYEWKIDDGWRYQGPATYNIWPREGFAVFWKRLRDRWSQEPTWLQERNYLHTAVHEIGHCLNLPHPWLDRRSESPTFMQTPRSYGGGDDFDDNERLYWQKFEYRFDPKELFHLRHAFYNEVVPGGRNGFMEWVRPSLFKVDGSERENSDVSLVISTKKQTFQFAEPVNVAVELVGRGSARPIHAKPSPPYGHVCFRIQKPDGSVVDYRPPVRKTEGLAMERPAHGGVEHMTSLAVDNRGFVFEDPGYYRIQAALDHPLDGRVVSRPILMEVTIPSREDEALAGLVFRADVGLFLYMGGGEHLGKAKEILENVVQYFPNHPFAAHAQLVLGLNVLYGQKHLGKQPTPSKPTAAMLYLDEVFAYDTFPQELKKRLCRTIDLFGGLEDGSCTNMAVWRERHQAGG